MVDRRLRDGPSCLHSTFSNVIEDQVKRYEHPASVRRKIANKNPSCRLRVVYVNGVFSLTRDRRGAMPVLELLFTPI